MKLYYKGFVGIELTTVIILILLVLVGFSGYIKGALSGRWRATGDAIGQGRQYDPRGFGVGGGNGGTRDCFYEFNEESNTGHWIDDDCFREHNCDCTTVRADGVFLPEYPINCLECKSKCINDVDCQ